LRKKKDEEIEELGRKRMSAIESIGWRPGEGEGARPQIGLKVS